MHSKQAPSTPAMATGPATCHGETDEGWKKVEGGRKGKGKKKGGAQRKEGSVPSWAGKAKGRGASMCPSSMSRDAGHTRYATEDVHTGCYSTAFFLPVGS